MSLGPIPSASIDRWADRHGYDVVDTELFRACIRKMDRELLVRQRRPDDNDDGHVLALGQVRVPITPPAFDSLKLGTKRR